MSIILKVQPEVLKTKASETEALIKKLESQFNEIQDIVSHTSGSWVGAAGEQAREAFQSKEEDIRQVIQRFKEHPTDLLVMAGVYEQSELDVKRANQSLPTDFVV